ncbi:MAG: bifunctional riboflavin kinase/FAD synthetase [Clostridia bacterium]|nr:bifunctional riboflavin kinase/FAD synthetase [Clostridia bacterium]
MQIFENTPPELSGCVVALGFFDGVHIGHRELIKKAIAESERLSLPTAVYTFREHPRALIYPDAPTELIYTNGEKAKVLESLGVDILVFQDFSLVRDMSPSEFIEAIIVGKLHARSVVCGYNFRFGKNNSGDVDTLRSLLSAYGISLSVIPPICAGDFPVSSGRIRELLEEGSVDTARLLLEHPYSIEGNVIHGHRIGHSLGFPTANLPLSDNAVKLPNGVYFTKTELEGKVYNSVTNIGTRPTVRDGETRAVCETHIIGYNGDIYGKSIRVSFYKMHRPETQFDSLEELSRTLARDVGSAVDYFDMEDL